MNGHDWNKDREFLKQLPRRVWADFRYTCKTSPDVIGFAFSWIMCFIGFPLLILIAKSCNGQ